MQKDVRDKGKLAIRKAYGIALRALRHANPNIVALDGDVKNSTYAEAFYQDPELTESSYKRQQKPYQKGRTESLRSVL